MHAHDLDDQQPAAAFRPGQVIGDQVVGHAAGAPDIGGVGGADDAVLQLRPGNAKRGVDVGEIHLTTSRPSCRDCRRP